MGKNFHVALPQNYFQPDTADSGKSVTLACAVPSEFVKEDHVLKANEEEFVGDTNRTAHQLLAQWRRVALECWLELKEGEGAWKRVNDAALQRQVATPKVTASSEVFFSNLRQILDLGESDENVRRIMAWHKDGTTVEFHNTTHVMERLFEGFPLIGYTL